MRNARPVVFHASWLPSTAQRLAAFRAEQEAYNRRAGARIRGYDRAWQELRDAVLRAEPMCRLCAMRGIICEAVMVDHIVSVRDAPERRLDPTNLQPLCDRCHRRKTNRYDGGLGHARQRGGKRE